MSLNGEPVRQSIGSEDGAKSVEWDEATPTSPDEYQGQGIPSQAAAAIATKERQNMEQFDVILFLRTSRRPPPKDKNKFFDRLFYQGGLERARRAVQLWCSGLGVVSCGMFP